MDRMDGISLEAGVTRVIVVGARGHFGRTIIAQLGLLGIDTTSSSRFPGELLRLDAEDRSSIRGAVRRGDLVIDAAGPYLKRSTKLVEGAIEIGFDLIDINDNLEYAERVLGLAPQIQHAGIRVLSSASSVSAVAAAIVRHSAIREPIRMTAFLAPAARHTSNPATVHSLLRTLGRPIRIWRQGGFQVSRGWAESASILLPMSPGRFCGRIFESADALYLPLIWPSLQDVSIFVDTNVVGGNQLLKVFARIPAMRRLAESQLARAAWIARHFGSISGGIAYEIEGSDGTIARFALVSARNSYITAVAPAVLAARSIAAGSFSGNGFVPVDQHVATNELFAFLSRAGIELIEF